MRIEKQVEQWAKANGKRWAQYRLAEQGISFSLAQQLTYGTYRSRLTQERVITAIKKAMEQING